MAAATARAPAVDKRGASPWGNRPMPPAPNAWDSSSLLSLKNDGGSGSFGSINDRPSSRGSSSTSTDGSDLLDSPLAWGRTSHNSTTAISHPESTELRSGSWQFSRSQTSFSDVLKAPLRTIGKRRSTSQGKGFTLSADEFPVLVTKNSQSNSQLGHSFQGRPTFSSVIMAARDEQRKIPITGGDPVSTTNFSTEGQQAQLHATQTSDICMPPPCIDYWHPPPDHPPDRNGIWHGGAASYGSCKPADTPGSFSAESFTHNGQSLLNQGGEARHGPVHGVYHPENNGSCYAHMPADACIKSLPHLLLGKIKDNHSGALEKQVIKKDVALLEKIKCLNTKARNLRAGNISEISSCRESKVEHPKSIDVEAYHVANDAPVCAVISDITSAFDMANSVSASSNHMPIGTSNVSASANLVMIDLSEGHATKFSEARKPSESADNHVYGVGNTSRNKRGSSATNTASDIWGPGWEEHSTVDSLPVAMTNTHEDQPFAGNSSQQVHVRTDDDMLNKRGSSATNTASDIWGPGYEEHSAVDSLPVAMTYTREDQPFAGNSSQQVHVRTADDMLNSPDYEIQHSRRELSAQHARQLQEERRKSQQKVKSIARLEDMNMRPLVQSQKSNDAPGKSTDSHEYGGWNASRNKHSGSAEDISFNISEHGWEDHPTVDSLPVMINSHQGKSVPWDTSQQLHARTTDDRRNSPGHEIEVHARTADMLNSPGYEIQHSRRELSVQHANRLPEQERGNIQQKAKSIAKLEDLNRSRFVRSQKSDDAPGKSADYYVYGGGNASRNRHDSSAEDISFKISVLGWEDHPTVDSLPVMTNTHQGQSFSGNTTEQVHDRTVDDMLKSPGYEIQLSRRELPAQHARQLQKEEGEKLQQKAKANAKLEELNRSSFVQNHKSNNVPLEADKVVHKQSAGGSGTTNYDTSTSGTYCTAYVENLNAPLRANGTKNTAVPISSMPTPDTAGVNRGPLTHNVMPSAKKTDINMLEHTAQKSAAWSHDSSASKHLQVEDREGQVHKQDSMPWISTPASDTADANKGPLMHNVIPSAKNTDVNMIHIGQKGASESHDSTAPMHLQMEDKRRQVHSQGRILRGPPVSESAGVSKGSLIHNVMLSAKNNGINMTEHIARKSASESHENSAPKHLQMGNRRWQVRSQERVLRERSNIAESTENITTVAGTLVDAQNAEAKPHMGLSTQSKNRRPASPHVFGTENTEASSVHKTHTSGVVINSAIIPVQVSSVRGFTVGSIMLGNASLASVNQEEKTVAKEVHDDITNSCASPKRIKQSGTNQRGVHHVKDPHGSDSIMHTPVKEPSKKEQSEAGGLNCTAIPAPTQPSGNQSIVSQDVVPGKTNEMERHAHKPAYKEMHLQNLRQMVPAENHTTSFDNSSTSKSDTKSLDKEALDAPTATKAEVKTVPENREDAKTSKHTATKAEVKTEPAKSEDEKTNKHVQRSCTALNQVSMNCSASAAPDLNEKEANSLVLKIMQDLSDQLEQVEKQLESSTNVATVNHSQPPQMVSRPGYTWGEHQASRSQRQYHVDGQGNVWTNSYIDGSGMAMGAVLPTTHLLPAPGHISVPQNNALNSSSTPGWAWDTAERVLISDMGDAQGLGAAISARSDAEPNQIVFRVGQMDVMHGAQAMGGMSFGAAASVGGSNHAGLELQQLNQAWFPHGQHDGGYHHGGMGMYFLGMDHGVGAQSHGHADYDVAGPMVGALGPDYQLVPLAPLPEAWVAAYGEHLYYV
ncbi:hypothetical protein BAE44_0019845 [Dichanthelium oligosanthes]|uniref:Uncharacterized protein n=1 Tax=Dichanthelium oligosanthes TaxID=888268 RepID=A0A1E5V1U8_9POAL|nr:hypothetical protein BAE44_0019845 [Dichanthelium oligosanthes]